MKPLSAYLSAYLNNMKNKMNSRQKQLRDSGFASMRQQKHESGKRGKYSCDGIKASDPMRSLHVLESEPLPSRARTGDAIAVKAKDGLAESSAA